ncbi:SPOR domain-containing protein [Seohaeicola saemankumensis]|nr:SPOR domain-containing protein [Seohaeicola saemankumensis]MCA0872835.1 SPOR domain-containing protein [Seohaeicola saemankumensis]
MVNLLGAVASVALIAGVGVWGYRLVVRDVSGVPVVRAVEGPMRIQPEDPGGRPADHQGLAVNAVAAQGIAAPTADRLVLAPRPVQLSDEDAPMSELKPVPVSLPVAATEQEEPVAAAEPVGPSEEALAQFREGSVDALVDDLVNGVPALTDGPEMREDETMDLALTQTDTQSESGAPPSVAGGPGLARSLRPVARPKRAVVHADSEGADVSAALSSAVDVSAELDVDPETLPLGTRLAQLGAYDSPEVARAEWDRLNSRFGDYMDGKKRVIQKASSGGRTFYRLRAMGFDDLSDARRFCSALVAENADCIPVTTR